MTAIVFGMVLPWLLLALLTWLGFQLLRQNGRLLLRLESIEKRLAPRPEAKRREAGGLAVGTPAPDFELPDLTGVRHQLSEFRDQNVLLIFFDPKCGFCTRMAPDLAALHAGEHPRSPQHHVGPQLLELAEEDRVVQATVGGAFAHPGLTGRIFHGGAARQRLQQGPIRTFLHAAGHDASPFRSALTGGMTVGRPEAFGFVPSEALPALDDDVTVEGIDFHQERPAAGLLGRDHGRAAAGE